MRTRARSSGQEAVRVTLPRLVGLTAEILVTDSELSMLIALTKASDPPRPLRVAHLERAQQLLRARCAPPPKR